MDLKNGIVWYSDHGHVLDPGLNIGLQVCNWLIYRKDNELLYHAFKSPSAIHLEWP